MAADSRDSGTLRIVAFACAVAGLGIALRLGLVPAGDRFLAFASTLRDAGWAGILGFFAIASTGFAFFFPGILLSMAAGYVWGPLAGLWLAYPACVAGGSVSFVLGRSVLRGFVAERLEKWPRLGRLEQAFADEGVLLVMLLRLTPVVPFAIQNYGLGASRIRFDRFLLGGLVGSVPACLFHAYLGSLLAGGGSVEAASQTTWGRAAYWLGLVASVAMVVFAIRIGRRALAVRLGEGKSVETAA